ncbi:MAG: phosphate/phosphite/phosphonate ABC transporter substrate-binding protein [Planctomycetes bacterium]|nr:phosphate/phosphite/phosphonate ABC transporter substrate-binding protein [Planctomycetota bacterium]
MHRVMSTALAIVLCLIPPAVSYSQEPSQKNVLTMGKVTRKVDKWHKRMESIVNYLVPRLSDMGIERGGILLAKDNSAGIKLLRDGKLDIAFETPFSACLYKVEANATPILLVNRQDVVEYNSIVFARKDSGIRSLEDLKGRSIAFEDPGSTSAYFLPKISMLAAGVELFKMDSLDSPVPEDKVGYVFAGEELNISTWVYHKKVAAGALSDRDWSDQEDNPESYRREFEIVHETRKVPRMLVIAREGLDKRLVERIKEELLNMHKTEEGREALSGSKIDRFALLLGSSEDALEPIEELLRKIPAKERIE